MSNSMKGSTIFFNALPKLVPILTNPLTYMFY